MTTASQLDPVIDQRARASIARQTVLGTLGVSVSVSVPGPARPG